MGEMALLGALTTAALGILALGAELLVRGASALAVRLGVSALAVGLTVVAFGTSTPELIVSLRAVTRGSAEIALGNVIGSNICNIALILGLAAVIRPVAVRARLFRLDAPLLVAVSILLALLLAGPGIGRVTGLLLLCALVAYTRVTLHQVRSESGPVHEEFAESMNVSRCSLPVCSLMVAAGLILLPLGAELLVLAALRIAAAYGVSESVMGLTIVAVGTSLPELAASVVAAARGEGDIAVGNVVGSNLFNLLGILGTTALVAPLTGGGPAWWDLSVMVVLAIVVVPVARSGFVVSRFEGALLVTAYVGYVTWLLRFQGV